MTKCLPGEHVWRWDAQDAGPPPVGLRCLCGTVLFGEDMPRLEPPPAWLRVLYDGRCERCRCPIDDHRFGMCPRFDYSR